jgi:hypothetical protein
MRYRIAARKQQGRSIKTSSGLDCKTLRSLVASLLFITFMVIWYSIFYAHQINLAIPAE